MHPCPPSSTPAAELPGMMATLCMYEGWLGPYHPNTLQMAITLAMAMGQQGELTGACCLLEKVLRDLQRLLKPDYRLRLRAVTALRDCLLQLRDPAKAAAAQRELVACQTDLNGAEHPETLEARHYLALLLLDNAA